MRLLLLSLNAPVPANSGVKMRTWSMLRALAAEGHKVTLITFVSASDEFDQLTASKVCSKVLTVPLRMKNLTSKADYSGRLLAFLSHTPYATRRFASTEMRSLVEAQLSSDAYDAVICESAYAVVNVPQTKTPIVLDNHNVEHMILRRYTEYARHPGRRLYARVEANRLRDMERDACRRASLSFCCSETDRQQFAKLCPDGVFRVVPNCIDLERYPLLHCDRPGTVLYQGGMDWFPNRDAVEFFAEQVLPLLRERVPKVRFVIAGRHPPAEFRKRLSHIPDVIVTGTVPDMSPIIAKATVCVVPLRIGSGTRLKILEAAAMGKAVVSTHVGAEGLDMRDGKEIILADTPEDFAAATSRLLLDAGLRAQLGDAARTQVERCYSFSKFAESLRDALTNGSALGN